MVVVAGPSAAGNDDGEQCSGGRSSGPLGLGTTACKRAQRGIGKTLRATVSMLGARPGPNGHRSVTGDERRRRRVSAAVGNGARG